MSQALMAAALRLERWIKDEAIPLWLKEGIDPLTGVCVERLDANGMADRTVDIRVRVQARQIFFFAQAFERGWCGEAKAVAQRMREFVEIHTAHPGAGGGFTHLMTPNYSIIDDRQDLYDHAFFLLAYAWCYRAFGDDSALTAADELIAHLDNRFCAANGGWIEGDYDYACRRQNPHMHLIEAFLALYDATNNGRYLARAAEIFTLFQSRFFDHETGLLYEFFNDDWTRVDGQRGHWIEPGHMMEWVWLLDWYQRRSGRPVQTYIDSLYRQALRVGQAPSGLLYDVVNDDGHVLESGKRCWPLTELIKASLVQIRAGHPQAEAIALQAVDNLFDYYLTVSTPGSYVDRRDADDNVDVDFAPASTLYHLIVAATELLDHCQGRVKSVI